MNELDRLLLKLRLEMLSERERNEIQRQTAKEIFESTSDEDIRLVLNRLLIEKYGELAVYDYLRLREKEKENEEKTDRSRRADT